MRWIEFAESVQFESEGRHKGPKFEKGERHHFEDGFADRWLRRGVAQIVEGPVPKARPKDETPVIDSKSVVVPPVVAAVIEAKPAERVKPRNG